MTEQTTETDVETPADETEFPESGKSQDLDLSGDSQDLATSDDDPETFPREYVVQLRDEAAKYRQRAADRDTLAERLHGALVAATGRLADPSDLPFDDGHLADAEALSAAINDLLARKPHLASRRPVGDVGQGATGADSPVDLAGLLRRNAS